jgi:hypothetical protein
MPHKRAGPLPYWSVREAIDWIQESEGCGLKNAYFKLSRALTRGYVQAVDGYTDPLSSRLFPDRLTQLVADSQREDFVEQAQRPEHETLIYSDDLLKVWPRKGGGSGKAADETKAIKLLAEHLKADAHVTREHALKLCRGHFPKISERGFRFRVWPEARRAAGLNPTASAGRKPKQKP